MAKKVQWTKIDPWPDEVAGEVLADELLRDLREFIHVGDHERVALVLWVFHAHSHDASQKSPYLSIYSMMPGCGKSTTGRVVSANVPYPFKTSNVSRPVLYRLEGPEGMRPTLFIDEAENHVFRDEAAISILNGGHDRSTSLAHRMDDDYDVVEFDTWMPKAMMSVGSPPATIADRSVPIALRRMRANETVSVVPSSYEADCENRRRRLARWAADLHTSLVSSNPELPKELRNRARDNWRPLIAIADVISPEWGTRAREAAIHLGRDVSQDEGERLLIDCADAFYQINERFFMSTTALLAHLNEIPGGPWGEMNYNRGMSSQQLAKRLLAFEIKPEKVNRKSAPNVRGYAPHDVVKAAKRFGIDLPSALAARDAAEAR